MWWRTKDKWQLIAAEEAYRTLTDTGPMTTLMMMIIMHVCASVFVFIFHASQRICCTHGSATKLDWCAVRANALRAKTILKIVKPRSRLIKYCPREPLSFLRAVIKRRYLAKDISWNVSSGSSKYRERKKNYKTHVTLTFDLDIQYFVKIHVYTKFCQTKCSG